MPGTHDKIQTANSVGFQFSSRFSSSSCSAAARTNGKSPFSCGPQAGGAGEDAVVSHHWLVCAWEASRANPCGPAERFPWLLLRQRRLSKDRSISMGLQPSPGGGQQESKPPSTSPPRSIGPQCFVVVYYRPNHPALHLQCLQEPCSRGYGE